MALKVNKLIMLNRKGLTILEMVIVLGLMGVVGTMMNQILLSSLKSQQRLQTATSSQSVDDLVSSMMRSARDSTTTSCLTLFTGTGPISAPTIGTTPTALSKLYYLNGRPALTVNQMDISGLFKISGISLSPQTGTTCSAGSTCALTLTVSGTKVGSSDTLNLSLLNFAGTVDAQKKLTGCTYQAAESVPIGNLTIVHSGEIKYFINNYQTSVTVRVIVQGPGGGGSQGGSDCYGNDGGYNGGNGAYADVDLPLAKGEKVLVNVGIRGKDGWSAPPEWGRDSTITRVNSSGTIITNIIVMGGRAYSVFKGFDHFRSYVFNDSPVSFVCNTGGSTDTTIQSYSNPCAGGSWTVPVATIQMNTGLPITLNTANGTMCNTDYTSSYYNSSTTFTPALGSWNKNTINSMYDLRYYSGSPNVQPGGFGNGGRGGWSGTDALQTPGQDGIGLIYLKSAP